jgi:peroxiredoxin
MPEVLANPPDNKNEAPHEESEKAGSLGDRRRAIHDDVNDAKCEKSPSRRQIPMLNLRLVSWRAHQQPGIAQFLAIVFFYGSCLFNLPLAAAQDNVLWTAEQKPLADQLGTIRDLDNQARSSVTRNLAQKIQRLPVSKNKLQLAIELANLSTEGDLGRSTIQAAATCLAMALREKPMPWTAMPSKSDDDKFREAFLPEYGYREIAQLGHYEHVAVALNHDPHYRAALAALNAVDIHRAHLDFILKDVSGKTWKLSELRGQVVLINFWATWCPPCRKEILDLDILYHRFAGEGLVVLGISDEEAPKIAGFLKQHAITYPVLLDSDRAVNRSFEIQGIPKSFLYDRRGTLVAQAVDMRTHQQLLDMLKAAGMQ